MVRQSKLSFTPNTNNDDGDNDDANFRNISARFSEKVENPRPVTKSIRKTRGIRADLEETNSQRLPPQFGQEEHEGIFSSHNQMFNHQTHDISRDSSQDEDEFAKFVMTKRAESARLYKKFARQEAKMEEFVALEDTTHQFLDDTDIALLVNQYQGRRPPRIGWEDPDEEEGEEKVSIDVVDSESDKAIGKFDDGLDQEAFAVHEEERIPLRVAQSSKEKRNEIEIDAQTLAELEDEEDGEEMRTWEWQQIRKGISSGSYPTPQSALKATYKLQQEAQLKEKGTIKIIHQTPEQMAKKLTLQLSMLQQQLVMARNSLTRLQENEQGASATLSTLTKESTLAQEQKNFYIRFKHRLDEYAELIDNAKPLLNWDDSDFGSTPYKGSSDTDLLDRLEEAGQAALDSLVEWKQHFPEAYNDAYGDLNISIMIEPLIQAKIVRSETLFGPQDNLLELMLTAVQRLPASIVHFLNVQGSLVNTVFVSLINRFILAKFDPSKSEHFQMLNDLLERLLNEFSIDEQKISTLLSSIPKRVEKVLVLANEEQRQTIEMLMQSFLPQMSSLKTK